MASHLFAAPDDRQEKGGLFRRKTSNKTGSHSVFQAQASSDVLGDFASGPLVQRQGSKRWGILAHGQQEGTTTLASAAASAEDPAHELEAARAECMRQGSEQQALRRELGAAHAAAAAAQQQLNLQRFKHELLVDLWAMRVLDNEELGSRQELQQ